MRRLRSHEDTLLVPHHRYVLVCSARCARVLTRCNSLDSGVTASYAPEDGGSGPNHGRSSRGNTPFYPRKPRPAKATPHFAGTSRRRQADAVEYAAYLRRFLGPSSRIRKGKGRARPSGDAQTRILAVLQCLISEGQAISSHLDEVGDLVEGLRRRQSDCREMAYDLEDQVRSIFDA